MVEEAIQKRGGDDWIAEASPHSANPRFDVRIMAPRS
jgi:hypothetical protein